MMNEKLIAEAVKMVIEYFDFEGIIEKTSSIRERAINWYNSTEITDAQTLAAVVMSGDFKPGIRIDEIKRIEEFFYPSEPIEYGCIHISEIEDALRDVEVWA